MRQNDNRLSHIDSNSRHNEKSPEQLSDEKLEQNIKIVLTLAAVIGASLFFDLVITPLFHKCVAALSAGAAAASVALQNLINQLLPLAVIGALCAYIIRVLSTFIYLFLGAAMLIFLTANGYL